MKVARIETFVLRAAPPEVYWGARTWSADRGGQVAGYPVPARRRYAYSPTIDTVLVRLETTDGVTGWGECKAPVAAPATAAIVNELLAPLVTGTRLDEIAVTWERMYAGMRVRGHDAGFWLEALSGVDIALWDAWGRTLGQPVHALLGGAFRASVPVYASGIPAADPDPRARGEALRDAGWTAVKVAIGLDPARDIAAVESVRDLFPRVFADAAGQYDVRQALHVGRALQELGVGFFEMPIAPEHVAGYRELAGRLDVPLALDSLPGRFRALEFLRAGALHVLQPDVCRAGGITETMRIAALADAFGAQATPHVSIGSSVHFAASLSCAAAIPNLDVVEHWIGDNPLSAVAAVAPPAGGERTVNPLPGLGLDIDEARVRALAE
ncbi:mandelate racemase/muconate lactonizing enzyme family protein [Dactylosporangium sp. NPDC005572]|uniref:mandelate racemase/muconate lactonizing enzyme family protein n=1 Tax=Dactylosporangium sp. NPDC005572 TaxID=3156889 RepID=UPI0033A2D2AC